MTDDTYSNQIHMYSILSYLVYIAATPVMTLDDATVNTAVVVGETVTFTCGSAESGSSEWFVDGVSTYTTSDSSLDFTYSNDKAGAYSCKNGNSDTSNSITLATGLYELLAKLLIIM